MTWTPIVNAAYSIIQNAPGTAGTTFTVKSGEGALFEASAPICYRAQGTVRPIEIGYLTGISGDTLTITRCHETNHGAATSPLNVQASWEIFQAVTEAVYAEIEAAIDVNTSSILTLNGNVFGSQGANKFLASPNGSSGAPTYRALFATDLPLSGVTAETYGDSTHIPILTVDAHGLISNLSVVVLRPVTRGTLVDHSGTITSGGASQTLMPTNSSRNYLLVQNLSSGTLWINFTTAASQGQPSIQLPPGAVFSMEGSFITVEQVNIIGASTGQAFAAKEG